MGEDYSSGATVSFECHAGYHLVGSDYITCLPNAEWSGSIPSCSAGKLLRLDNIIRVKLTGICYHLLLPFGSSKVPKT